MGTDLVKAPRINEKFACFKLLIRRSKIHRYGVFAGQRIPSNRKVIEYTGKRLNRKEAKIRGDGDYTYLFAVDPYWTLDGSMGGSGAEIINHSCNPNLVSRIMKGHVLYMSLRTIKPGEELTVNYNFDKDVRTFPCSCGAPSCGGAIGKPRSKSRLRPDSLWQESEIPACSRARLSRSTALQSRDRRGAGFAIAWSAA